MKTKYCNVYRDKRNLIFVKFQFHNKTIYRRTDENDVPFKSPESASRFIRSYMLNDYSSLIDVNNLDCFSIHEAFKMYLIKKYKNTSAYSIYTRCESKVFPFFDKYLPYKINNDVLTNYSIFVNSLNYKTKNTIFVFAKIFLNYLSTINPEYNKLSLAILKTDYTDVKARKLNYWTYDEFMNFYKYVDDLFYQCLFMCLYVYGLRISELLGLKYKDFTLSGLTVCRCRSNKTFASGRIETSCKTSSSNRIYPFVKITYDLVINIKGSSCDDNFVFDVSETTLRRVLKKYIDISRSKKITFHGFRHSCASYLINNGADYMQVASWLGHSSPSITLSTYSHLFPNRKNDIAMLFNKK